MSKRYHLYAIGNALVDTELEVSDDFLALMEIGKGMMTLVDEARQAALVEALNSGGVLHRRASGGSACNTAVAARYFGASTYYTCKVADDETGNFFVDDLRAAGVDTNMMNGGRPQGVSGKCLVMVTPDAERTMNTFLGISETVSVAELDEDAIRASEFVYIEGYLVTSDSGRAAAIRLRELAEQHGVRTALTFSDPAMTKFFRDGLEQMLGNGVDLLFCNEEEALHFTGADTLDDAVASLAKSCRQLVVTRGARGALVCHGDERLHIDPVPVKAVDTNGAGDMFAGAFLYAITHGHSLADAGRLASAASAQVVSDFGPRLRPDAHATLRQQILGE